MFRFQVVIAELIRIEENHGALAKQLEGRQKEYNRVLDENKTLQASGEEVRVRSTDLARPHKANPARMAPSLQARKAKVDKEVMQKQAESLTREYDRLSKELEVGAVWGAAIERVCARLRG